MFRKLTTVVVATVVASACAGPSNSPKTAQTPPPSPTPNLQATVQAAVSATVQAVSPSPNPSSEAYIAAYRDDGPRAGTPTTGASARSADLLSLLHEGTTVRRYLYRRTPYLSRRTGLRRGGSQSVVWAVSGPSECDLLVRAPADGNALLSPHTVA
jgi:hypothetical protein